MVNPSALEALAEGIEKTACLISSIENGLSNHEACSQERDLSVQMENHAPTFFSSEDTSLKYQITSSSMVFGSSQIVSLMLKAESGWLSYECWHRMEELCVVISFFQPFYSSFLPPFDFLTGCSFTKLIFEKTSLILEIFWDAFLGCLKVWYLDFFAKEHPFELTQSSKFDLFQILRWSFCLFSFCWKRKITQAPQGLKFHADLIANLEDVCLSQIFSKLK